MFDAISSAAAPIVAVAHGDGIGPEIMAAALEILEVAGARMDIRTLEIGEGQYRQGHTSGIAPEGWETLRGARAFFQAPITTPQGGGMKSLNVTIRKTLGLYANVRPCSAYSPYVATKHPDMDLVIVRENEEDLYAGIEHRQTDEVFQCLKLVSRPGCERIVRYAFEYARANRRAKVSCFTKDNIMKLTDGLFHQVFNEIGEEYPDIVQDHWIVDIGTARLATRPEDFDVIVTTNLYGDIISDVAAEIAGSVGLAGSANIGRYVSMYEAIHASAPDIAGQDLANPSGLLLAGVMMMNHLGQSDVAQRVHNAWLRTLEDGIHTGDVGAEAGIGHTVGTRAFAAAVISRLGQEPQKLAPVRYSANAALEIAPVVRRAPADRQTVGVDLFVQWRGGADDLAAKLKGIEGGPLELKMITNRGVKVWPGGIPETFCTDHWRCRFMNGGGSIDLNEIVALSGRAVVAGVDFIKTEHLCTFDGEAGFTLGQGQ